MTLRDEDLVADAREGDRAAFDILARRYRPGVMAVTLDMTRRVEVATDLTQDALLVAWERIGELRDPARFAPWLRTIAANRARMWLRRPVVEVEAERVPEPEVEDVAAVVRRRELERALRRSLLELPAQNRLALLMHCISGASYAEIAAFLDVPETTVEGRIYRARQQLRRSVCRMLDEAEPWR